MKQKILKNPIIFFTLLLVLTIFTRFIFMYSDPQEMVVEPEKLFGSYVGLDLMIGVMNPALQILQNTPFYTAVQTYGPSFSILMIPILKLLSFFGGCASTNLFACGLLAYRLYLISCFIGFLLFITYLFKKDTEGWTIFFLFIGTFILSMPGSLGIQRGNLDIIYALLLGILTIPIIVEEKNILSILIWSIITGIITGFIANSKIFFLPFSCILSLCNKKPILTSIVCIATYLVFSYFPLLYKIPSTPLDPVKSAINTEAYVPLANPAYLGFNLTFSATATLFTSCVDKHSCDYFKKDAMTIVIGRILLGLFVFVLPFLLSWKKVGNFLKNAYRESKIHGIHATIIFPSFVALLLVLAYVAINLLPNSAFLYRLTYSIPLFLLLYRLSKTNTNARYLLYLSMMFLIFKGQWVGYVIHPLGFTIDDPRFMNLFVVLHAFFLIKSAVQLVVDQKIRNI
jgi:hypothetical protein